MRYYWYLIKCIVVVVFGSHNKAEIVLAEMYDNCRETYEEITIWGENDVDMLLAFSREHRWQNRLEWIQKLHPRTYLYYLWEIITGRR